MCGVATTRGCLARRQSTGGSCVWTSRAAPATRPLSRAASSASSSISSPARRVHDAHAGLDPGEGLAAPGGGASRAVSVVCRVMKSRALQDLLEGDEAARAATRPPRARRRGRRPSPPCPKARAAGRHLPPDAAETHDPEALARGARTPAKDLRSHFPAFMDASACGMLRASERSRARASSAVETRLPPGEFITMTPRRVAAWRSTLSTPTPGRPMTLRFFAASSTSAVIWLPLRIRIAW